MHYKLESKILYGKSLADKIMANVAQEVKELKKEGVHPSLMTVMVGDDPASRVYLTSQKRQAETVGINCELVELSTSTSEQRLLRTLDKNHPASFRLSYSCCRPINSKLSGACTRERCGGGPLQPGAFICAQSGSLYSAFGG